MAWLAEAAEKRRGRALEAAVSVVESLGVVVERPVILADSNNTIVWLAPAPIVAKVGTSHFLDAELESLTRELAVAAHLSQHGAPIVAPPGDLPAGPHRWRGLLTHWQYVEPIGEVGLEPAETAAVLGAVHDALAAFPGLLPPFDLELADARRLLLPAGSPTLPDSDRRFLLSVTDELEESLAGLMRSVCVAAKCWVEPNRPPRCAKPHAST